MYKVDRRFIGTNGHVYEVGDEVQRHVYNHFTGKHKRRCSYIANTGKVVPAQKHNVVQESKPEKLRELQEGKSDSEDNTLLAAGIGAAAGFVAGELVSNNDDSSSVDTPTEAPSFGGDSGFDGGGTTDSF